MESAIRRQLRGYPSQTGTIDFFFPLFISIHEETEHARGVLSISSVKVIAFSYGIPPLRFYMLYGRCITFCKIIDGIRSHLRLSGQSDARAALGGNSRSRIMDRGNNMGKKVGILDMSLVVVHEGILFFVRRFLFTLEWKLELLGNL